MTEKIRYSMLQIPFGWYVVDYSNELKPGGQSGAVFCARSSAI